MLFSTRDSSAVLHHQSVTKADDGPTYFTTTKHMHAALTRYVSWETSNKLQTTTTPWLRLTIKVGAYTN